MSPAERIEAIGMKCIADGEKGAVFAAAICGAFKGTFNCRCGRKHEPLTQEDVATIFESAADTAFGKAGAR